MISTSCSNRPKLACSRSRRSNSTAHLSARSDSCFNCAFQPCCPIRAFADVTFKEVELYATCHAEAARTDRGEHPRRRLDVALLAIACTLEPTCWETANGMDNWDNVILWEGMEGYTPSGEIRPVLHVQHQGGAARSAVPDGRRRAELLQQRQRLKDLTTESTSPTHAAAPAHHFGLLVWYRWTRTSRRSRTSNTDLSSNNSKDSRRDQSDELPQARTLNMGANTRKNIYDLSNTVETNYGGLVEEQTPAPHDRMGPRHAVLSVNHCRTAAQDGRLGEYTEQDIIDADTLPRADRHPKVMPHTKRFAINLNRLTGELPDWLLYHPALDWWVPSVLAHAGGQDASTLAGFTNEPANMNYYYEFYEDKRPVRKKKEDDQYYDDENYRDGISSFTGIYRMQLKRKGSLLGTDVRPNTVRGGAGEIRTL